MFTIFFCLERADQLGQEEGDAVRKLLWRGRASRALCNFRLAPCDEVVSVVQ